MEATVGAVGAVGVLGVAKVVDEWAVAMASPVVAGPSVVAVVAVVPLEAARQGIYCSLGSARTVRTFCATCSCAQDTIVHLDRPRRLASPHSSETMMMMMSSSVTVPEETCRSARRLRCLVACRSLEARWRHRK